MALLPPPTPPICASQPAYTVEIDVNVDHALAHTFTTSNGPHAGDTGNHLNLNGSGDLDFTRTGQPVAMIFHLKDGSGTGLKFDYQLSRPVFSFAWDWVSGANNPNKHPIGNQDRQIQNVAVTDASHTTVTACYFNTQFSSPNSHTAHARSQYGLNLLDRYGHPLTIDPGVSNGNNKMAWRPHRWPHRHWRHYHRRWLRHHDHRNF